MASRLKKKEAIVNKFDILSIILTEVGHYISSTVPIRRRLLLEEVWYANIDNNPFVIFNVSPNSISFENAL